MAEFIFEYGETVEQSENVQTYICESYVEGVDFTMSIGYGDDIMNAFEVLNEQMLKDKNLLELLSHCTMFKE